MSLSLHNDEIFGNMKDEKLRTLQFHFLLFYFRTNNVLKFPNGVGERKVERGVRESVWVYVCV